MWRSLALKGDGTVVSWGNHVSPIPRNLTNVIAIAAGGAQFERNLALKADGTVVAFGESSSSRDAQPPPGLSNVVTIAVGERHSLALKKDGTVVGWGLNTYGEATGVPSKSLQDVASGLVRVDGQVLSNVVAIAAGNAYGLVGLGTPYSLALKQDGTVVAWGRMAGKPASVPAGLSNVVALAAGQLHCLAIQAGTGAKDP
jgi:alpha-tubulin suppressor-like RCC1 family protein